MRPPKSILDRSFAYTKSHETDLAKTFAKIRRQQQAIEQERVVKVAPLNKQRKTA